MTLTGARKRAYQREWERDGRKPRSGHRHVSPAQARTVRILRWGRVRPCRWKPLLHAAPGFDRRLCGSLVRPLNLGMPSFHPGGPGAVGCPRRRRQLRVRLRRQQYHQRSAAREARPTLGGRRGQVGARTDWSGTPASGSRSLPSTERPTGPSQVGLCGSTTFMDSSRLPSCRRAKTGWASGPPISLWCGEGRGCEPVSGPLTCRSCGSTMRPSSA